MLITRLIERAERMNSTGDPPVLPAHITIEATHSNREKLASYGVTVGENMGRSNLIVVDAAQRELDISLDLERSVDGLIVIGVSEHVSLKLTMRGANQMACLSGVSKRQGYNRLTATLHGNRSLLHIGSEFTCVSATIALFGDDKVFSFGPDCMLSWSINMTNYDQHTIFDIGSGDVLNGPTDMRVGRHVWIGQDVLFTRGFSVGDGSIIGTRALVTADVPGKSLSFGVPSRVHRSDVSWTRTWMADRASIERIQGQAASYQD